MSYTKVLVMNPYTSPVPVTGGGGGSCDLTPVTDLLVQTNSFLQTVIDTIAIGNNSLSQVVSATALANMKLDQIISGQGTLLTSISQVLQFVSEIDDDTSNIRAFSSGMNNNLIQILDRTNSTVIACQSLLTLFSKSVDGSAPLWINRDKININLTPFQQEGTAGTGPFNSNWKVPKATTDYFKVGSQPAIRAIRPNYTAPGFDTNMVASAVYQNETQVLNNCAPLTITLGNVIMDIAGTAGQNFRYLNTIIPDGIKDTLSSIPNVVSHGSPDRAVINAENVDGSNRPIHITPLLKGYEVVSSLEEASNDVSVGTCNI